MLIILEGADASGKTTLLNELRKWRPWFIFCKRHTHRNYVENHALAKTDPNHDPYPTKWDFGQAFMYDWRFFLEVISFDPQGFEKAGFVFDRCFITNHIFNDAIWTDHQTQSHIDMLHAYEHQLSKLTHVIFYCKRDVDANFTDSFTEDCPLTKQDHDKLQASYDKYFAGNHGLNVIELDNNKLSIQEAVSIILNHVGA